MAAQAIIVIECHVDGVAPADVARRIAVPTAKPKQETLALARFFDGAMGLRPARTSVRVDSGTPVQAARTLTITGAAVAAGEYIGIVTPGGAFKVTGVASGAVAGDGTFVVSDTDDTAATNIRAAINTLPGLKDWVTASGNSNSVVITANANPAPGIAGNGIRIVDGTGGGIGTVGLLTGGISATARVTASIVCVLANTDNNDTVGIGAVTLTAKTSGASGENEFNLGASNAAMAVNLAAAINAHSQLAGIVTADGTTTSGTVALTMQCDPRTAIHIRLATSDADGMVITQPTTTLTVSNAQATRVYAQGAAA
jgi:hypothetical protein